MNDLATITRQLRPDQSLLTLLLETDPDAVGQFLKSLTPMEAVIFQYRWDYLRRPPQVPPEGSWSAWVILGGRGMGKTRPGAEQTIEWAREMGRDYGGGNIALIGKDPGDLRKVMIEGESGILACSPPWFRPVWYPTKQQLMWDNGVIGYTYSAEVPENLRGPNFHKGWCDELPKWQYPKEVWDMYSMAIRLGTSPQTVITTTPRPVKTLIEILKDPETVVTRGTTQDNYANLSKQFLGTVYRRYKGTRLGRQELNAELLTDTPGALWTLDLIDAKRKERRPVSMKKIVVAIDPQGADPADQDEGDESTAETGIVGVGLGVDDDLYVLADRSGRMSPDDWGTVAVELAFELGAEEIVGETNNGGAMVEFVVRTSAEKVRKAKGRSESHSFVKVTASRGKRTRAEPISQLYEQGRAHHIGSFSELEDQMTTWMPGSKSPDRMDALVWGATRLMFPDGEQPIDYEAAGMSSAATW